MAVRIVNTVLEDLKTNGLDSEHEVVPKDPEKARDFAVKRKVIEILKAGVNVLYRNEFKVELEKYFRQEFQKQGDLLVKTARTESSGTPEEKEIAAKNLVQKIQACYPPDVFKSLQKSWKIWCNECWAYHDHVFTADDVTTLLRRSAVKKNIESLAFNYSRFGIPFPRFDTHVQVVHLGDLVRQYIQSRLEERQEK